MKKKSPPRNQLLPRPPRPTCRGRTFALWIHLRWIRRRRSELDPSAPPTPSAAEQKEQADAYRKSASELDARVELSGHSAKEMEMTFERFMASLYMTAMLQLGLMQEERGQPRIDLLGARQTVDTLGLLAEKTKGNLTPAEENFLQNCLYELRMAYVEVTNALARPPQATGTNPAKR